MQIDRAGLGQMGRESAAAAAAAAWGAPQRLTGLAAKPLEACAALKAALKSSDI
jgi:hypothetical protein